VYVEAQSDSLYYQYEQEDLTDARDGIDYSDEVVKEKDKKKEDYSSSDMDFSGIGDVFGYLLIGVLIALVFVILYFMLGKDNLFKPSSKKIEALDLKSIEQIEENLEEYDVSYYLQQAIDNNQYRIAIRLHYLLIIKELSAQKFIKWKRDKTNRNYLYETQDYPFAQNFKRSTNIFEKVWYGERNVTEGDFSMIHSHFSSLNKEINQSTS
jgi:hypothetical protein